MEVKTDRRTLTLLPCATNFITARLKRNEVYSNYSHFGHSHGTNIIQGTSAHACEAKVMRPNLLLKTHGGGNGYSASGSLEIIWM